MAFNAGLGVMMLGAAGAMLSAVVLRWLGWMALVLGIVLFIPFADFFALLLSLVWIIVTSIAVTRGGERATRPQKDRVLGAATVLCLGLAVTVVLAAAGTAASGTSPRPVYQPPQSYHLALGDSIAYGLQPDKVGARPSAVDTGYVDVFAARLRKLSPTIQVVNYGCPGESTVTFTRGGCPWLAEGRKLHDPFRGSQLKAALSFLRAHRGQVSPITLTLWGADLVPLSAKGGRAPKAIASVASRLSSILKRLRGAAPTAEIIVTGAWNPEADRLEQAQPLYRSLDAAIARAAGASQARVANMLATFNPPGSVRTQRARLCKLTFFCSKGDPHPTDAGYRAMADAFVAASGYPRKP